MHVYHGVGEDLLGQLVDNVGLVLGLLRCTDQAGLGVEDEQHGLCHPCLMSVDVSADFLSAC